MKHMRDLVRHAKREAWLRRFAMELIQHVPDKNFLGEVHVLFNFVRYGIRYALDTNDVEVLQSPDATIMLGYGDCDDKCICLAALLEHAGHAARFVALAFSEPFAYTHVIVQTSMATESPWLSLDATEPYPMGWEPPGYVGPPLICEI